jgi:hypothetical protein
VREGSGKPSWPRSGNGRKTGIVRMEFSECNYSAGIWFILRDGSWNGAEVGRYLTTKKEQNLYRGIFQAKISFTIMT